MLTPSTLQKYPTFSNEKDQTFDLKFISEEEIKKLHELPVFESHRKNSLYGKNLDVKYPDSFYLRVNKNLQAFYTESRTDTIILGAMKILRFRAEY